MDVKVWLEKVSYIGSSDIKDDDGKCYYSKYDGSYITRVGVEESVQFLADRGITKELTHGVGYSPDAGKWYGWSHRAIYGFKVGSTCKKGDAHFRASNIEEELEAAVTFWDDEYHDETKAELKNGKIIVSWIGGDKIPNEKLRGKIASVEWDYDPDNFGRGEWVAETMEDAKQMAIDFNRGVS